jgi:hypothetical protein
LIALGRTGSPTLSGGSSLSQSAAGSAAEQAIVHSVKAPFERWSGACSGQCCVGIAMAWRVTGGAAPALMPKGISIIASSTRSSIARFIDG